MKHYFLTLPALLFMLLSSCNKPMQKENQPHTIDPLPSWNDTKTKQAILSYIEEITDVKHARFVPETDRITAFDNDGTLWTERPLPPQIYYCIDQLKLMAKTDTSLFTTTPYSYILNNQFDDFAKNIRTNAVELALLTNTGMEEGVYRASVTAWMDTARHPQEKKLFTDLVFQPMQELKAYLITKGFTVFIVSGGTRDFMRVFSNKLYDIPTYRVVGSTFKMNWNDHTQSIDRNSSLELINDHEGKPVGIYNYIGKKPVFIAGNSDGDFDMMQYAESSNLPFMNVLVTHNDDVREYNYGSNSKDSTLKALSKTSKNQYWVEINMKDDWKTIYKK